MVTSCGIDLVEIERIRRILARYGERFARRLLSQEELSLFQRERDPAQFLAGRFAAKEAVLKVLGCGIFQQVRLRDIVVRRLPSGQPVCLLLGSAAEKARERGIGQVLVSISHTDKLAIAQALGLAGTQPAQRPGQSLPI